MQLLYNFDKDSVGHKERTVSYGYFIGTQFKKNPSRGTQTDFRESEAQTEPWESEYQIPSGENPEVLTLASLQWNKDLPVGFDEIEKIEKLKIRKALERMISPIDCTDVKAQKFIIALIDKKEWEFRDKQLQINANIRMEEIELMMKMKNSHQHFKRLKRFEKVSRYLNTIRDDKIKGIKQTLNRELRQLSSKYESKNCEHQLEIKSASNLATRESKSQFKMKKKLSKSTSDLRIHSEGKSVENEQIISTLLPPIVGVKILSKRRPEELCIRETRWTDEQLRMLHNDLKNIRLKMFVEKKNSFHKNMHYDIF